MILETVRMVTDWWADEQYGINAQLARVSTDLQLDDGDQPLPLVKKVLDPTRDLAAAREQAPADWPVVLVRQWAPAHLDQLASQGLIQGGVDVSGAYVTRQEDGPAATYAALYTLRAMVRSLEDLMAPGNQGARQRGGVHILEIGPVDWDEVEIALADGHISGLVVATCQVRDTVQ
jgi:hypothetical protein